MVQTVRENYFFSVQYTVVSRYLFKSGFGEGDVWGFAFY